MVLILITLCVIIFFRRRQQNALNIRSKEESIQEADSDTQLDANRYVAELGMPSTQELRNEGDEQQTARAELRSPSTTRLQDVVVDLRRHQILHELEGEWIPEAASPPRDHREDSRD